MFQTTFPVIDLTATGKNILRLRKEKGLSVRDLQTFFGFEEPQAIYKWQQGKSLPTVDNLYALGAILKVPIEEILVSSQTGSKQNKNEQQNDSCCSSCILRPAVWSSAKFKTVQTILANRKYRSIFYLPSYR